MNKLLKSLEEKTQRKKKKVSRQPTPQLLFPILVENARGRIIAWREYLKQNPKVWNALAQFFQERSQSKKLKPKPTKEKQHYVV